MEEFTTVTLPGWLMIRIERGKKGPGPLQFYKVRSTEYGVDLVEAPCGVCPVLSYAGRR